MKEIFKKIKNENPTFVLMLGLCPTLATTGTFESAYIMGLCVLFVLLFSNIVISLIRKLIPDNVKLPVFILIVATFVTIIELLLSNYVPELFKTLGIYLSLVAVNCIVLGRALMVASKKDVKKSIIDGLGIGIGFLLALMLIGLVREILGNNTITLMNNLSSLTGYEAVYQIFPTNSLLPIKFFTTPAGAFLTLGVLIALFKKGDKVNESN